MLCPLIKLNYNYPIANFFHEFPPYPFPVIPLISMSLLYTFSHFMYFVNTPFLNVLQIARTGIQALPFTSCINLGKLLNHSISQVPLCKIELIVQKILTIKITIFCIISVLLFLTLSSTQIIVNTFLSFLFFLADPLLYIPFTPLPSCSQIKIKT